MIRGRLASKYLFFEMLPSFLMGVLIFGSILLMFQALRLTEFLLVHGVSYKALLQMLLSLSIGFLPATLPMSLLFAVLLTYGRLSADSEIIALRSLGLRTKDLLVPALALAMATALFSAYTSLYLAPWGNNRFERLLNEVGRLKAAATIKPGVFSDGFFDLVLYANKVDEKKGKLSEVFIYDERSENQPLTIIAKKGEILTEKKAEGHSAQLRLINGSIHRSLGSNYTKVDFHTYDISLFDPAQQREQNKTLPSYSLNDLNRVLKDPKTEKKFRAKALVDYHRRFALAGTCLIFGLLGVGLGTSNSSRSGKSSGMVLCIVILVSYWISYVAAEGLAKSGTAPPWLAIWMINFLFGVFAIWTVRRLPS